MLAPSVSVVERWLDAAAQHARKCENEQFDLVEASLHSMTKERYIMDAEKIINFLSWSA